MAKDLDLNRNAQQDNQQVFSQLGVQGTAGTADTKGTAPTIPFAADPTTGAQYVYNLAPVGTVSVTAGTSVEILSGTINKATVNAGTINAGTVTVNAGAVSNAGTYIATRLTDGTSFYNASGGAGGGTSVEIIGGTINKATINAVTPGTAPTSLGKAGSTTLYATGDTGVAALGVRNESFTTQAGTEGQYIPFQMDRFGRLYTNTEITHGTVEAVTTLANLTNGSIRVTAGTINTGTINSATINAGTIGTVTAIGQVHNAGTLAGGTIGEVTNGSIKITAGTVAVTTPGTITSGSVAVTAGTITNLLKVEDAGHITGDSGILPLAVRVDGGTSLVGTDLDYAPLQVDANGALRISGTVAGGGASGGTSVQVEHGTIEAVTTITTLSNLTNGSVKVTAGTINTGTINAGTINSGTINLGTVVGKDAHGAGTTAHPILSGGNNNGTARAFLVDAAGVLQINGTVATGGAGTQAVSLVNGTLNAGTVTLNASNGSAYSYGNPDGGKYALDINLEAINGVTPMADAPSDAINFGNIALGVINVPHFFNGATYTQVRGDSTNGLDVDVTRLPNVPGGTITNSGTTTGVGVVTALTSGSIAVTAGTITNLLKVEDAGHTTGESGVMPLAVRVDGGTSLVGTDLDYAPLQVDANGALRISGTVAGGAAGGTSVQVEHGTIEAITTVTTLSNLTNGSVRVTAGTVSVVTPGTITSGSIAVTAGTINTGTINLGTMVGNIAAGQATASFPVYMGGNNNGTVRALALDATGAGSVIVGTVPGVGVVSNITNGSIVMTGGTVLSGTINNSGTTTGVGVLTALTNGTVRVEAGTMTNSGTVTGVGVVSNITNGSIVVTAGTVTTNVSVGTISVGTINSGTVNAGTINLGTVVGKDAIGAATTAFPVLTGGNNNGTVRGWALDATGAGSVNVVTGTVTNSGTTTGVGVVTALTNGTIRVEAGTMTNSGTTTGVGVVTTVSNLTAGSIAVTAGTVNAGTINSGTINAGTITNQPFPATQVQSAYAVGTAAIGTLVAAIGAGTGIYPTSITLTAMSGTLDMVVSFGLGSTTNQVVQRGLYAPGGGVALSYPYPSFYGTSNSALTYQILSGAGTASWAVTYATKGTP
jgi:fibronectin-binding autotransporter adhesin